MVNSKQCLISFLGTYIVMVMTMQNTSNLMMHLYSKLDGHQCGAPGLWDTIYEEHTS